MFEDSVIYNKVKEWGFEVSKGSELDVLDRFYRAVKNENPDWIVRVTSDCPLIDPQLISQFINTYKSNNCEYLNNCKFRTYPIGMDIQIYPTKILEKSFKLTKKIKHREHVTLHILENPNLFKHLNMIAPPEIFFPKLGLTLDEINDYKLIKKIFLNFFKKRNSFSCLDIVNYLNQKPKLKLINIKVKRKKK